MPIINTIRARGAILHNRDLDNSTTLNLLIVVLTLVFVALVCLAALLLIRRSRTKRLLRAKNNDGSLPQYNDLAFRQSGISLISARNSSSNPRRLTIETRNGHSSVIVLKQNSPMLVNPDSPPHSPDNVPEIHITFPEEEDEHGRRQNGRVLVVRVGDNAAVGLEPLHLDEQLPAYEKETNSHFYSLDLDRIGGLKEKDGHIFV